MVKENVPFVLTGYVYLSFGPRLQTALIKEAGDPPGSINHFLSILSCNSRLLEMTFQGVVWYEPLGGLSPTRAPETGKKSPTPR